MRQRSLPFVSAVQGNAMAKQQRFWEVDLVELVKRWLEDMGTFLLTAITFVGLALPVIIPIVILWWMVSSGITFEGGMTLPR